MARAAEIPDRILVAIGGNATHPQDIEGTSAEQKAIAADTAAALLPLAMLDNQLVITHGNGPVVGKILMRQALTRDRIAPMPLDICVAHSQGGIAYLLVQALENALRTADNPRHVACLLTQVEVDPDDPAFLNPDKPIGPFFEAEQARRISEELGWLMKRRCRARLAPRGSFTEAQTRLRHFPGPGARPPGHRRHRRRWRWNSCGAGTEGCTARRAGGHRQGSDLGPHGQRARHRVVDHSHGGSEGGDSSWKTPSAGTRSDQYS